jgi:hypothetical protein
VKGDESAFANERTLQLEVSAHANISVVAINEQEVEQFSLKHRFDLLTRAV